ncbi:kinase-like domain-containing protein [Nemania abortiva]|nr:kinase-like domain-containing protein [Nemania abortiva]
MPFEIAKHKAFLRENGIPRFLAEQYRPGIGSRQWKSQRHIVMYEGEPLPFDVVGSTKSGGFGSIDKVRDLVDDKFYAIKRPRRNRKYETDQLKNEAKLLEGLAATDHVVQLVAIYERGEVYGIILEPYAEGTLADLLDQNAPGINTTLSAGSFGCLSLGLSLIHEKRIRHKDVKPENVLYDASGRFLWADFGLAYGFGQDAQSQTNNPPGAFSDAYAASEILVTRVLRVGLSLIRVGHGRSADVFSLGCVFIRILVALIGTNGADDLHIHPFRKNKAIRPWVARQLNGSVEEHLRPVLQLAFDMAERNPIKRPDMPTVLRRLAQVPQSRLFNGCDQIVNEILGRSS